MAVCVCVRVRVWLCVLIASLLDRAREALRDRATHISGCARPTARCVVALVVVAVVAVVVVPYVVVGRVCVWVCVFFDRAREATRDRATHGNACARSAARWVAVVVVAAAVACVVVACGRVWQRWPLTEASGVVAVARGCVGWCFGLLPF